MDIKLAPQQHTAMAKIDHWLKSPDENIFVLHGYAGTGKTTLARYISEFVGLDRTSFLAYTGKAASVLRSKGCASASTIHQAIYKPSGSEDEELRALVEQMLAATDEEAKEDLRNRIMQKRRSMTGPGWRINLESDLRMSRLVVIDECSMLNDKLLEDIQRVYEGKILLLGDPAQLPPVKGAGIDYRANYTLTEIHRQAMDNPILRAATEVRETGWLKQRGMFKNDHGFIHIEEDKANLNKEVWLEANQVIVGRNATRQKMNMRLRELLTGRTANDDPCIGDKAVILRNDHSVGICNGMVGTIESDPTDLHSPYSFFADFKSDDGQHFFQLNFSKLGFNGEDMRQVVEREQVVADYGYALTCHKAQGSEWDTIAVMAEPGQFDHRSWLYTAITRARRGCSIWLQS